MLKFNKPINQVKKELLEIDCKLEPEVAQRIIDNVSKKCTKNISKVQIAQVLNSFLKFSREFSVTSDNFGISKFLTILRVTTAGKIIKFVSLENKYIKNNLECYVDEII